MDQDSAWPRLKNPSESVSKHISQGSVIKSSKADVNRKLNHFNSYTDQNTDINAKQKTKENKSSTCS